MSGITVLVLVGVVVSSMLLGSGGGLGEHGPGRHAPPSAGTESHTSGGHTPSDGRRSH